MDRISSELGCEQPRLLVVERNRSTLQLLSRRLTQAGYRVTTAESGTSAIAELYRRRIDLVLAEFDLPRMSGAELAGTIRADSRWNDIPVMLISGRSEPKGAVRAYSAGADDVIIKPFNFEILVARIGRRIEGARQMRMLREDNATLDARVVERAIEIGELRDQLSAERISRSQGLSRAY